MITRQAKQIAISVALPKYTVTRLDGMSADSVDGLFDAIELVRENTARQDSIAAGLAAYEAKRVGAHSAPGATPVSKSTAPVVREDGNAAALAAYAAKLAARQASFGAG
jgi:hypothetical protein